MAEGILAEVSDGVARLQFLDKAQAGPALTKLLAVAGPEFIDVDTRSGSRKIYIVLESIARDAGLLDEPEPVDAPEPEPASLPEGEPSDAWTVVQLREFAARQEIVLGDATKKADILARIDAALHPAPPVE